MGKIEWFIALRYLRGKRKLGFISWITYISAAGVCVGSFVLVVALSIANGFEKEVRERIVGTLAHGKVLQYHSRPITGYEGLLTRISQHPDVIGVSPYISGKGAVEHRELQNGVKFTGVDPEYEHEVTEISRSLLYGSFHLDSVKSKRERSFPGIVIGSVLAEELKAQVGSEIVLMSLATVEGESDPVPKMGRFTVSGIFETGMYDYDKLFVYISIPSAQMLLNMDGVEGVQIKTTDLFKANEISLDLRDYLGGYPFRVVDWQTQNRSLFEWMRLQQHLILIIVSLIMVVAVFNIISTLIMMILEKRREIGILMGMGSTSGSIMKIFMVNGVVIGFIGSTLGMILGLGLCFIQSRYQFIPLPGDVYFINTLPVLVKGFDVLVIFLSANIICWLATLYPAWKASAVLPAESMRYD
ncbi:ABC transporter permease [Chitinispirillales bacterium ANBcel5]|uniref:FtsX-like permease family protein n=1 Tax=Cellulosispirillum alkaliphilum TaxID=3039283 RepID=UPI002A540FBA|nr:ABC transporter permease [Chitinispirillales bacterium ANBcel5]